jgi:copper chaperone CopZ
MKYTLITGLFISSIFAEVNTTQIKVDGMQCSYSCAGKVSTVVQNINGVKDINVDFDNGIATVTYDNDKVEPKDIVNVLTDKTMYKISEVSNQIESEEPTRL